MPHDFYPACMRKYISQTVSKITALLLILLIASMASVQSITAADARDCVASACISVYIHDGQIVIEGRRDAPTPIVAPKPRVTRSPFPSPISSTPTVSPTAKQTTVPRVIRRSARPKVIIRKVIPKVVAAVSLNDRLVKLLPVAAISQQPEKGAVVGVRAIFWCDLPSIFTSKVSIVGEVIDVTMRPVFFWSFGDGSVMMTTESGAPYPSEDVSHNYSRAGTYPIVLVSIWGGTWIHNGIARAITGEIRKTSVAIIKVAPAPTIFRK